jgi:hypothetical protein
LQVENGLLVGKGLLSDPSGKRVELFQYEGTCHSKE